MNPARVLACAVTLWAAAASAWGFDAHRRIVSRAHQPFPASSCLRAWVAQVSGQFAWQDKSCDPDRWRSSDPAECRGDRFDLPIGCEGPHHYLDIDFADPITDYPRDWAKVQERFGGWAVANGRVPWRVEALHAELVAEFAAKDSVAALDTVAHLAHYVTDAHSPMHATKRQPGSCPACAHLRYETQMFDVPANIDAIDAATPSWFGQVGALSPKDALFEAILRGHPVSDVILATDAAQPGDIQALFTATSGLTARRWGDSLTVLASLVGSAWLQAGSPLVSGMPPGCIAQFPSTPMLLAGQAPVDPPDAGTTQPSDAGPPPVPDAGGAPAPSAVRSDCGACGAAGGVAPWTLAAVAVLAVRRRRRHR